MRGCACRGDSAGFVHLDCLTELAVSKEASRDFNTSYAWLYCGNCKQDFQGALELEMVRRFWRRHRSSLVMDLRYNTAKFLAGALGRKDELDAANQLLDEASTCVGNNTGALLDLKLYRADLLKKSGQNLEALGLLQAMLPEVKAYTANPHLYDNAINHIVTVLIGLHRYQEAHDMAIELVQVTKARYGQEDPDTLVAMQKYAYMCMRLGRMEEAKATFENILTIQTRVLGREHPDTQVTWKCMQSYACFDEPSG